MIGRLCRGDSRPAQQRLNPRDQLGKRKRLDQIIIAAVLQTADFVGNRIFRTQHNDRHGDPVGAQLFNQRKTIHSGEHDVDNRQITLFGLRLEQAVRTGRGMDRRITGLLQALEDEIRCPCVILHQKNLHKNLL